MPPRSKPARRVSARRSSRKSAVSPREFEFLLERAEKFLSEHGKKLQRSAHHGRKTRVSAA
jgi:hypothetical protein